MKKHENGQGLVEYSLILVLVVVVVIAGLLQTGPIIGEDFCRIVGGLDSRPLNFGDQEVTMGITDDYLHIDVKPEDAEWLGHVCYWEIRNPTSQGNLRNNGDGTFAYWPDVIGAGTDDSFTYEVGFRRKISRAVSGNGRVAIIVGERDEELEPLLSKESIAPYKEKSKAPDTDDVMEHILTLYEAALWQEESLNEGVDFNIESILEGVEVLQEYADDVQNQLFFDNLSQYLDAVEDGNWEFIPVIYDLLTLDLNETPLDVYIDMNIKMAPRLIAACDVVSNGYVPPDLIVGALEALEGLDDAYPRKAEIIGLLEESVEVIETRNFFIHEHTSFQSARLDKIVELLETAGEFELAEQLAVESEACSE